MIGFSGIKYSGHENTSKNLLQRFKNVELISTEKFREMKNIPTIKWNGSQIPDYVDPISINWNAVIQKIKQSQCKLIFVESDSLFYSSMLQELLTAAIIFEFKENEMLIGAKRGTPCWKISTMEKDFSNPSVKYYRDIIWSSSWKKNFWQNQKVY